MYRNSKRYIKRPKHKDRLFTAAFKTFLKRHSLFNHSAFITKKIFFFYTVKYMRTIQRVYNIIKRVFPRTLYSSNREWDCCMYMKKKFSFRYVCIIFGKEKREKFRLLLL